MYHFIVNPAAGNGSAMQSAEKIKAVFESAVIHFTTRAAEATALAREIATSGKAEAVVAVGGDGTIQEIITGLTGTNVPLAVIPMGSGNDFAKSMGLSKETVESCAALLKNSQPQPIDLIEMDGHYCGNIASVGLDADIVRRGSGLKKRYGKFAYIAATLYCARHSGLTDMELTVDGKSIKGKFNLAAVCNGIYYGGGYAIAPDANPADGFITLCLVEGFSKLKVAMLFPTVLVGRHKHLKGVQFINCKTVSIRYPGVKDVNIDGNLYELSGARHFTLLEKALLLYTPKKF